MLLLSCNAPYRDTELTKHSRLTVEIKAIWQLYIKLYVKKRINQNISNNTRRHYIAYHIINTFLK